MSIIAVIQAKRNHLHLTLVLLCLILLIVPAHSSAASTNLIANNSFENSTQSQATSWRPTSWGSNSTAFSIKNGVAQDGRASSYLNVTNYVSGDSRWNTSPIAVTPGVAYSYSSWYKSDVTTEIDAEIKLNNGRTKYVGLKTLPPSDKWQQVSFSYTPASNVKEIVLYHVIAANGTLETDNYSLSSNASATPPPPVTPPSPPVVVQPPVTQPPAPPTTTPNPTTPPTQTRPFSKPLVSIEFDDGWTSAYNYGLPIVESFGWQPTQYVITDTAINNQNYGGAYMTPAQIKDWNARGDIGSHSVDHSHIANLPQASIKSQLTSSKQYLDSLIGEPTRLYASPYCESSSSVVSVASTLYQSVRNCGDIANTAANFNPYSLWCFIVLSTTTDAEITNQLNQAKANNSWITFVWHEVAGDTGNEYSVSQGKLRRQLQLIKDSGINVVTSQQALNTSKGL